MINKRLLQVCVAIAGLVPVTAGIWGLLGGLHGSDAGLMSQERYLSGLLLGIGLVFWSTVPGIETKAATFRLLTLIVVAGGLCRLIGVALGDGVSGSVIGPLAMELTVTPLLCLWQARLARTARRHSGPDRWRSA
jgi:hypothetical protein